MPRESPDPPPAGAPPRRVLLVDDDPITRQIASRMLAARGFAVTTAGDGRRAVNLFRAQPYDVVMLDVEMPELDGPEAARRIRDAEPAGSARALLVGLSAHRDRQDRDRCLAAGMDAYITKPLERAALERALAGGPQQAPAAAAAAPPSPGGAAAVDWQAALEAVAGDRRLLARVAASAVRELPGGLAELRRAAGRQDREATRLAAHALHGALRIFAPQTADHSADRLEQLAGEAPWEPILALLDKLAREVEDVAAALAAGPPPEIA